VPPDRYQNHDKIKGNDIAGHSGYTGDE